MRFLKKKCYEICTYKYLVVSSLPFDEENSINCLYHNPLKTPSADSDCNGVRGGDLVMGGA